MRPLQYNSITKSTINESIPDMSNLREQINTILADVVPSVDLYGLPEAVTRFRHSNAREMTLYDSNTTPFRFQSHLQKVGSPLRTGPASKVASETASAIWVWGEGIVDRAKDIALRGGGSTR